MNPTRTPVPLRCLPLRAARRPTAIIRFAGVLLAALAGSIPAAAQSPAPLPRPDLHLVVNGSVQALLRLPDGSLVFGGTFTSVNGQPRANLAKLRPDGTLDPDWNPAPDREVYALAADTAGNVYVGGWFYAIGGQSRTNLAKVSATGTGTADASWNPAPDSFVYALAVDAGGAVYAGGQFGMIGGQNRANLAKLAGTGSGAVDATWDPAPDSTVRALTVDGAGNVYAGGQFFLVGGQARRYIARISGGGVVDATWNPTASGLVGALALDGAGGVYAGGEFTTIGGQARPYVAKLSTANGTVDAGWNPAPDRRVGALAVDAAGHVYASGLFTTIGGQARNGLAKLSGNGSGAADANWNPSPQGGQVSALLADAGRVYAGGSFFHVGGAYRLGLAMLSGSGVGAPGAAVDAETPARAASLLLERPYGMLVGGEFLKANGILAPYALRLKSDGTIDTHPSADDAILALVAASLGEPGPLTISGVLRAVVALPDGSFVFGGAFTSVGGTPRNYLAKLRPNGTLDPDWNPNAAGGGVYALATDGAGNVYAGGRFTSVGGQPRNRLAKIAGSGTGAVDPAWNPGADEEVSALAVDAAGRVYAGGSFTHAGGQARARLARLAGTGAGAADPSWNPGADRAVTALATDPAGWVYVGGKVSTVGGIGRDRIARLDAATGAVDPDWNPGADADVLALARASSGVIYAGGRFDVIGGASRNGLAALPASDVLFADDFEP
ncbi:delta-60 repeat domain-containing protein [Dokdonella koreensis]|uniref:Uncharacterized protein n=1 Tax=Dokdonella koreensis DS-123 TaxID=1300342 RepID=A0A160DY32_9GAMM|nr:delta-60 repeat domain-containing protein [Dokdonella koreensis]ANB19261.1 Hypothetical protein I596_3272 [Dokdonella koreensis DS-123]